LKSPHETSVLPALVAVLVWCERIIFFAIGVLLFGAAVALLIHAGSIGIDLFVAPTGEKVIESGGHFLDMILVTLMFVELAYTMILTVRGQVLLAEPFLIVGLIAVIRRILVLTIGEVSKNTAPPAGLLPSSSAIELLILTLVVIGFVFAIFLWRQRKRNDPLNEEL
jgi:hypothetical protein